MLTRGAFVFALCVLALGCDAQVMSYGRRPGGEADAGPSGSPGVRFVDGGTTGPGGGPTTGPGSASPGASPGGSPGGSPGASPGPGSGPGTGPGAGPGTGGAVAIPVDATRPVDILPRDRLAYVAERMPPVDDGWLKGVLESADTMWYDKQAIIPGYQDSAGDDSNFPTGFRPNTIEPNLIVTGGHEMAFADIGHFHFPFGRPARSDDADLTTVNFWQLPRDGSGQIMPMVYWRRHSSFTNRYEWMFPVGTVFGEVMFIIDPGGERWVFEVRVRVREIDHWRADVFRPFRTAAEAADAIEAKRAERSEWQSSSEIDALISQLRGGTMRAGSLSGPAFPGAFATVNAGEDDLPGLSDNSILQELLRTTPLRSARGMVWKDSGGMHTYAPTTQAEFSLVPRNYGGGFLSVDDATCEQCHRDAGRPLKDWHDYITLYGEMWGMDDVFTWHPFVNERFVDGSGNVVQFNYDNREFRSDFASAGVIAPYDEGAHPDTSYRQIVREWTNFTHD